MKIQIQMCARIFWCLFNWISVFERVCVHECKCGNIKGDTEAQCHTTGIWKKRSWKNKLMRLIKSHKEDVWQHNSSKKPTVWGSVLCCGVGPPLPSIQVFSGTKKNSIYTWQTAKHFPLPGSARWEKASSMISNVTGNSPRAKDALV